MNPKAEDLYQYGIMGSIYAEHVLGIAEPRIGLLNVGSEDDKGTDLTRTTRSLFQNGPLADRFVGNVEGRDIYEGHARVVVCEGFVGNVLLKAGEGAVEFLFAALKQELGRLLPELGPEVASEARRLVQGVEDPVRVPGVRRRPAPGAPRGLHHLSRLVGGPGDPERDPGGRDDGRRAGQRRAGLAARRQPQRVARRLSSARMTLRPDPTAPRLAGPVVASRPSLSPPVEDPPPMPKIAFLFPGQGAQFVGMGRALYDEVPAARALFDRAGEILGFDLKGVCFEGPADALEATDVSQPAIYVASLAALEGLKLTMPEVVADCSGAAGLSLGEYTALAFAGSLDFEAGLRVVRRRGEAMQAAARATPSGMTSVIGLDEAGIDELCRRVEPHGRLWKANLLGPGNIVVSGELAALGQVDADRLRTGRGAGRSP